MVRLLGTRAVPADAGQRHDAGRGAALPGGADRPCAVRDIAIGAPHADATHPYIDAVGVNGRSSDRSWRTGGSGHRGGSPTYRLVDQPQAWATGPSGLPQQPPTGPARPRGGQVVRPCLPGTGPRVSIVENVRARPLLCVWGCDSMFDCVLLRPAGARHFCPFDEDDALRRQPPRPRTLLRVLACTAALLLPVGATLVPAAAAADSRTTTVTSTATHRTTDSTESTSDDPATEVHGLKGEYFSMSAPGARDFAELGGVALDPEINFPGLTGTFENTTGRTEHTTARWTGRIEAPDDRRLHLLRDRRQRVPALHRRQGRSSTTGCRDWDIEQTSAPVALTAGEPHDFRLEMFQDVGGANMFLRWSSAGLAKQIVPESAFTPPADFEVYPVAPERRRGRTQLRATFDDKVERPRRRQGSPHDRGRHLADAGEVGDARRPATPRPSSSRWPQPVQKGQQVRVAYDGEGGLHGRRRDRPARSAARPRTSPPTGCTTTWGDKLDREHPLPEYPRPQQVRDQWKNLNGPWEFAGAAAGEQPVFGKPLDERITVPFPVESQLSGLERHEDHMFYRKLVTVPEELVRREGRQRQAAEAQLRRRRLPGPRLGQRHAGRRAHRRLHRASAPTSPTRVKGGGPQEIVVAVTDTTGPNQPKGKQSTNPGGIVYTAVLRHLADGVDGAGRRRRRRHAGHHARTSTTAASR